VVRPYKKLELLCTRAGAEHRELHRQGGKEILPREHPGLEQHQRPTRTEHGIVEALRASLLVGQAPASSIEINQ